MRKVSIKIADVLLREHYIDDAMYNVYQYGLQMALEIGCATIASILVCFLMGMFIEGLIFFAIFIPLRSCLGGFHLKNYWSCFICSCFVLLGVLALTKFLTVDVSVSWLLLAVSLLFIFHEAKKAQAVDDEGKYFYSKICILVVCVLVAAIVFFAVGAFSELFLLSCTNTLVAISKLLETRQTT